MTSREQHLRLPAAAAANASSGPSVQSARDYVARVKSALGPNSPQYRRFLDTLKGYRLRSISPQDVILRVSELFRGRNELILGFNAFLPREFQIREVHPQAEPDPAVPRAVMIVEEEPSVDGEEEEGEEEGEPAEDEKAAVAERLSPRDDLSPPKSENEKSDNEKLNNDDNDDEDVYVDDENDEDGTPHRRESAQDPRPRRKRLRRGSKDAAKSNIKIVPFVAPISAATTTTPPKNKINSTTQIILAPPKLAPADHLHPYDPIKDGEFTETIVATDRVNCGICRGRRDAQAEAREEPVLLCEQKGCNAEYHLGCLYNYRPALFPQNEKPTEDGDGGAEKNDDEEERRQMAIPEGDIFCSACHSSGAAAVLEKYFDKTDYERSHYSCSRAYVYVLLEKHMRENPDGNVVERSLAQEKAGIGEVRLKNPPRSELWYADELSRRALVKEGGGDNKDSAAAMEVFSAELLIGKPVRLYNNLDNEYHVGRIVDWRTCTAYPPLDDDSPPVSEENTVHMNDLEYYGLSPISTSEFLVRFPSGLQGRRKELLRWIVLEEHSLAVGVSLIRGKTSKSRGGSSSSSGVNDNGEWKPAMILARSALELVTVRQFLHEDERGNLFGDVKIKGRNGKAGGGSSANDDRWALASFFGEEQHALLNLREEARDLLEDVAMEETDSKLTPHAAGAPPGGGGDDEMNKQVVREDKQQFQSKEIEGEGETLIGVWAPLAAVDVPLGLALAEHSEQERCREWYKLILQKSAHEYALVSSDEYSMQMSLEKRGKTRKMRGTSVGMEGRELKSMEVAGSAKSNGNSLRPLVERGMDRLWLAQLAEKVSPRQHQPYCWSKDALMSFKCENVSSVSKAAASLNRHL